MSEIFIQLGIVLAVCLAVSWLMKFLKQPLVIGYILTGILVGPSVSGLILHGGPLESFSHIGIALLLFIVGLGLRPNVVKEVGKVAVMTGLAQILVTTFGGYFVARALGLSSVVSLYLSFAFALSSTIIILRLLYAKEEQETLYGRITIGFLLVQDLAAMIFFIFMSAGASFGSGDILLTAGLFLSKIGLIILGVIILLKYIIPRVDIVFAENKEMLFVFSLSICFAIAAIFYKLNFPMELGALMAGVILSVSPYQREIALRLQSLRDFFLIIFFIMLGANVDLAAAYNYIPLIIVFSLFILIGNPIILILVMRYLRYTLKVSFLAGLTVSQISEFSLIILGLGIGLGHLPPDVLAPATIIGIITIAVSTYYITYNYELYNFLKKPLHKIFSDKKRKKEFGVLPENYEVILFGAHRLGGGLVREMRKMKMKYLVVDHDPEVIDVLSGKKISCLYGSIDDPDLIESLPYKGVKLVISTVPELDANLALLNHVKKSRKKINVLCIAGQAEQADKLYRAGATYVIMPPYLGRRFMVDLLKKNKLDYKKYRKERERHIFDLSFIDNVKHI